MKVFEAAEYLSLSTGQEVSPKQLLVEVQTKFPGLDLSINSELPEDFVEQVEMLANKVQDNKTASNNNAQAPAGGMGMATASNGIEAVNNAKGSALGIIDCVQQALSESDIFQAVQLGLTDGLAYVNTYRTAKEKTIAKAFDSMGHETELATDEITARREAELIKFAEEGQRRLGEWSVKAHNSRMRRQQAFAELEAYLEIL
ncbi:hypothetical protein H6G80_28495 [Nostoc sp. FACHB-87]|uniref:hypothetical protein n=1 Tax=Nostocaceae TaxID=1162 RepID=UPI001686F80D|nr:MULTISPECIES: hypothetical protein [Nostocaceae]MBD2457992.1 hypothetical protein [Nostoc sp. FACHB-87]MBD2479231.1 hypothetical protein [Anabaena sp. FACHB-83]